MLKAVQQLITHEESYELTDSQLEFYKEQGYLHLKDVWPKADIDALRKDIDRFGGPNYTVKLTNHWYRTIKILHRCKKLCDIGDAILGDKAIPVGCTTFYCKPGNEHEMGSIWHQDNYAPMCPNGNHYLNIAVVLDDADKSNGSLQIVPGSHKLGMLPFKPSPNFTEKDGETVQAAPVGDAEQLSDYGPEAAALSVKQLEYKSGDVLVIGGLMLHKADKNPHPTKWRRTIYCVYVKDNEPFWPGRKAHRKLFPRYDSE